MIVKNFEKNENGTVAFHVEIDKAGFEAALNQAYIKNRKSIMVPGFRKGKAPRMIIEGMYGKEVFFEDAINIITPDAFEFGVEQEKLNTVGKPSMLDMHISDEMVVTLSFETGVYPEVTLGQYKGIEAVRPEAPVTDEDVDAELDNVRNRNARIVTVNRKANIGDTVIIDFEGFLDGVPFDGGKGEGHNLTLGSGQFVPGFEEQLVGAKPGEEKEIDITFPEDYHEELAGKEVVFKVKVIEVKESQKPELDDEFAKDVSEFDTLEEYKNSVRADIAGKKETAAQQAFRDAVIEKAVENMSVVIPDTMIDEKQESIINEYSQNLSMQGFSLDQYLSMSGMNPQAFFDSARPAAIQQTKIELLLSKIVEIEAFEVTDEEYDAECAKIAEAYGVDAQIVRDNIGEERIKFDAKMRKATDLVCDSAVAVAEDKPKKKPAAKKAEDTAAEDKPAEKKPAVKKSTAKKTDDTAAEKKTAAEKTETAQAKKPAAKEKAE